MFYAKKLQNIKTPFLKFKVKSMNYTVRLRLFVITIFLSLTVKLFAPPSLSSSTSNTPSLSSGTSSTPTLSNYSTGIVAQSVYINNVEQMQSLRTALSTYINEILPPLKSTYSLPANSTGMTFGLLPVRSGLTPIANTFTSFTGQIFKGTALNSLAPSASYPTLINNLFTLFKTYNNGLSLGFAFTQSMAPFQAFQDIQNAIINYVKGVTSNISPFNYGTDDGRVFIGNGTFYATKPTATVSSINQVTNIITGAVPPSLKTVATDSFVAQLNDLLLSTVFSSFSSTYNIFQSNTALNSGFIDAATAQKNYTNSFDLYLYNISAVIAQWGYTLIAKLASYYPTQAYIQNTHTQDLEVSFYGIPEIILLDSYGALTVTAVNQLAQLAQVLNKNTVVGPYAFQVTPSSSGLSPNGKNFVAQLEQDIYSNLASLAGYAGLRSLEMAGEYAVGGKTIATTVQPTIANVATVSVDPQSSSNQLKASGALNLQNKTVTAESLQDPALVAQAILTLIADAYQYFTLAYNYYQMINDSLMMELYATKTNQLSGLLTHWQLGVAAFQNSSLSSTSTPSQVTAFMNNCAQAQDNFNAVAQLFNQMGNTQLGLYVQKLSAQIGIIEYQQILQVAVAQYGPHVSNYIQYCNAEPIVSTDDWNANVTNAQSQVANFKVLVQYLVDQLKEALKVYDQELSFYSSLGTKATVDDQKITDDLRKTTQIFEHLASGFSAIGFLEDMLGDGKIIATSFTNVLDTIMQSEDFFIKALNEFQQADALIAQATPGVLDYVQLQNLFMNQDDGIYAQFINGVNSTDNLPKIITFYDFAYLHRARLCYHAGQLLAAVKEPLASYLLWVSLALYQTLDYKDPNRNPDGSSKSWACNNLSKVYSNILVPYLNTHALDSTVLLSRAQALIEQIQKTSSLDSETIAQLYQKVMKLYFTLFEVGPDIITASNAYQADGQAALAWLQGKDGQKVPYSNLKKALINYQLYLMSYTLNSSNPHNPTVQESSFLKAAQDSLQAFKQENFIALNTTSTVSSIPTVPTQDQFNQLSVMLQQQMDAALQLEQAKIEHTILQADYYASPGTVAQLDFSAASVNFSQQLAMLYYNYATSLLQQARNDFKSGASFNSDSNTTFNTIIQLYQQASNLFIKGGDTVGSLNALRGVSSALAWHMYCSIIPVFMSSIVKNKEDLGDVPLTWCNSDDALLQSYTAHPWWPDYVLHYSETIIPDSLVSVAQTYLNKTVTTADIVTNLVIPLKKFVYNQALQVVGFQVQKTSNQDMTTFIQGILTEYQQQASALLSGTVVVQGVTLKSSYSVIQKTDTTGKTQFYLVGNNVPLPAFSRFSAETETAALYYMQGPLALFSAGTQPVNVEGSLFLPAPDQIGVTTINSALLNTYYVQILRYKSRLSKLLSDPIYLAAQQLSAKDLLTLTANSSQLAQYSTFYNGALSPALIDLLSSYETALSYVTTLSNPVYGNFLREEAIKSYMQWIQIAQFFLCGDPTAGDGIYASYLSEIVHSKNKAMGLFLQGIDQSSAVMLNNELIRLIGGIFENTGDILSGIITPFKTVAYPEASSIYPLLNTTWPSFYKWQDASNYYQIALNLFKTSYIQSQDTMGNSVYGIPSDLSTRLYGKLVNVLYQDAAYKLAVYGFNAFKECKCKLYSGTLTTNGKTQTVTNAFETATMAQSVESSTDWHNHVDTAVVSDGTQVTQGYIVCDDTAGKTFIEPIDNMYQGVAAQLTSLYKPFLTALSGSTVTNIFNSDGTTVVPTHLTDAADLMKSTLLSSICSLSLLSSVGTSVPTQSIQNLIAASGKSSETVNAVNQYLCGVYTQDSKGNATVTQPGVFNSNPGFATTDQIAQSKGDLLYPAIQIFVTVNLQDASGSISKQQQVKPILYGSQLSPTGGTILSNRTYLYTPTLQYWSSLPRFLSDLQKPVSLWLGNTAQSTFNPIDPATFFSWVSGLNTVARSLYANVYLPFVTDPAQQYQQIDNELMAKVQNDQANAALYVG